MNLLLYLLYGDVVWIKFVYYTIFNGWGGYALWFIPVLYISLLLCKMISNERVVNLVLIDVFLLIGWLELLSYLSALGTLDGAYSLCLYFNS